MKISFKAKGAILLAGFIAISAACQVAFADECKHLFRVRKYTQALQELELINQDLNRINRLAYDTDDKAAAENNIINQSVDRVKRVLHRKIKVEILKRFEEEP